MNDREPGVSRMEAVLSRLLAQHEEANRRMMETNRAAAEKMAQATERIAELLNGVKSPENVGDETSDETEAEPP